MQQFEIPVYCEVGGLEIRRLLKRKYQQMCCSAWTLRIHSFGAVYDQFILILKGGSDVLLGPNRSTASINENKCMHFAKFPRLQNILHQKRILHFTHFSRLRTVSYLLVPVMRSGFKTKAWVQ